MATARTLAQRPQLILADEFLSELDDANAAAVMETDDQRHAIDHGTEHHEEHAVKYATRVWMLDRQLDMSIEQWLVYKKRGENE